MNFLKYLAESTKSYHYVIKFAEMPTKDQIDMMETWLKKYDLQLMTPLKLDEYAMKDFIDIQDRQVHSINITLGHQISSYVLLQDLKTAANISEKMMVVRGDGEPIERYSNFDNWSREEDAKEVSDGFTSGPRLSTDREYNAAEQPVAGPLYGDEYNKKLLSYLAGIEGKRPTMHVDPPAPLFDWIKMDQVGDGDPHQDVADFNERFDTPKPTRVGSDSTPIKNEYMTTKGGMSDAAIPSVKFYKDQTGKLKQVVRPVEKK